MKRRVLMEFETPEQLARVARELRARGYRGLDAHTPYSTETVRDALGFEPSPLSRIVFAGALLGASAAYLLEWYINAVLYPLNVGGRPPHMPLAFVPICFEMGVLAAAFTAFGGVLIAGKLLRLWEPVFEVEGFESASVDRFWLSLDASRAGVDPEVVREQVAQFSPARYVVLGWK